ncbi:MAG: hypothetical protein LBO72_00020 [Helicobacteraceae bacterium]|jgi:hypothetical protein|nr:hypothetical protein [Helicobacteraceae bacterium]
MSSLTIELLRENTSALNENAKALKSSYDKCVIIGAKKDYSDEELIHFEALMSRYARSVDLLIHKALRSLDVVEFAASGTVIDAANRAEKRGIVDSVDQLRNLKDLRNEIAHEYISANIFDLFKQVIAFVPPLLNIIDRVTLYASKYLEKDAGK